MSDQRNGAANAPPNAKANAQAVAPQSFTLERDEWGQLVFVAHDGTRHSPVTPLPLFPISEPVHWVSIRSADGVELACIENPNSLAAETQHEELVPRLLDGGERFCRDGLAQIDAAHFRAQGRREG